ncbi:MAG: sigma-70 family RNA polymerase sigma factor [Acidobacteria bacterium]|nr:sigma-70 family RNA polymerase sigma factor [Acidobacteriota bacterium]
MQAEPKPPLASSAAPFQSVSSEKLEEIRLVEASRNGDRAAFARLYEQYARMVHGIVLARAPRSEADDLVQDVFFFAWRKIHTLRDAAAFGGWLGMIARNRAMDYHRQKTDTEELTENMADSIAEKPAPKAEAIAVLDTIRALPEAYRETLILRLVEGMTGPEISVRTGLTPESVRVNLHRGMKMLRERLNGFAA